jgi:NAD(P)-dependent dehydrogenase (short-subunit alcohol dehydrogenase family)
LTGTRSCTTTSNLENKSICITGGNVGIGLATAEECARAGASYIVILCRNTASAAEAEKTIRAAAKNKQFEVLTISCDLGDLQSVRECVKTLEGGKRAFDVLFLNAGLMLVEGTTKDGFENHMGVNHFGHFLLTNLIWKSDLLNENARVVALSSSANRIWSKGFDLNDLNFSKRPYSKYQAYGASKSANILMMQELQRRFALEGKGRFAFSVHPGFVRTKLMREPSKYLLMALYPFYWSVSLSPREGTQCSLYAATSPEAAKYGGAYFENLRPYKTSHLSKEDATELWKISEEQVGLNK